MFYRIAMYELIVLKFDKVLVRPPQANGYLGDWQQKRLKGGESGGMYPQITLKSRTPKKYDFQRYGK